MAKVNEDPRHHHRERVRNDFLLHGLEDYEPHRVLELLLFYAIPRKDTKQIAYRLIQEFGSLKGVFDAPIELIEKVEGLSTSSAILIKMIPQLAKRYYTESLKVNKALNSPDLLFEYFYPRFIGENTEALYLLTLDSKRRAVKCKKIATGVSTTEIDVCVNRVLKEIAVSEHSVFVIAHNHPDMEDPIVPSHSDERFTRTLATTLRQLDKKLYDHIIISGENFFSYRICFPNLLGY